MKTIILPGYSEHNREWAYEIKKEMGLDEVVVHEWGHWVQGSFSLEKELERVIEEISKIREIRDGKINIIAKSVGTSVAMYLLQEVSKQINKLVLCGIPINGFSEERKELFRTSLPRFNAEKMIVFQNSKDNLGSFAKVERFVHSIDPKIKVVEKPRSDHHYPYPEDFREFLLGYLGKSGDLES